MTKLFIKTNQSQIEKYHKDSKWWLKVRNWINKKLAWASMMVGDFALCAVVWDILIFQNRWVHWGIIKINIIFYILILTCTWYAVILVRCFPLLVTAGVEVEPKTCHSRILRTGCRRLETDAAVRLRYNGDGARGRWIQHLMQTSGSGLSGSVLQMADSTFLHLCTII